MKNSKDKWTRAWVDSQAQKCPQGHCYFFLFDPDSCHTVHTLVSHSALMNIDTCRKLKQNASLPMSSGKERELLFFQSNYLLASHWYKLAQESPSLTPVSGQGSYIIHMTHRG